MMRAAVVPRYSIMEVADFPVPTIKREGDLLVRMHRASICGSDVHTLFDGLLNPDRLGRPGYPGHEGVGEVVDSRSPEFPIGTRLLTVPTGAIGGCFAEYQLISQTRVVPLPTDGDMERLLMAQQYGTTLYAMRTFWPGDGSTGISTGTAAVIGAGSAGLFFLQQLKQLGFDNVVVSDLNAQRLEVARLQGADVVLDAETGSLPEATLDLTDGQGADLVIEAAGYDSCRADAITAVRPFGTVGYFGLPERFGTAEFPMYEAFRKAVRIQWAGKTQEEPGLTSFRDAIRHIQEGRIDVEYCLGSVFGIEELPQAMEIAREHGNGAVKLSIDLADAHVQKELRAPS
ncbi:zinc-binding dehydrogenase [Phytoactinopolyspora endophytica]|uniref:zinc-binding dehydrogenase n=1 Tax=Phytoactinopolyspora endophytica TaxID=1642495 RepID=UPI00197C0E73|nr:zinc-binding dehydrogenase [Phytoactinopolyspora endophytica]